MQGKNVLFRGVRRFCRHDGGNMAIEFALALPILCIMLVGMLDLGRFGISKSSLLQAARAGAQYGITVSSNGALPPGEQANVNLAAQTATTLTGVTATSVITCECGAGVSNPSCNACTNGATLKRYLQVNTSKNFSSVLSAGGLNFGTMGSWTAPTTVGAQVITLLP